jgi:hypothetical protein
MFQTRLEISEHAAAGLNDTQIAERVRCSVWTVRKWRRRWRKLGHLGFTSQMGHPVTGLMSTLNAFFRWSGKISRIDIVNGPISHSTKHFRIR